MASFSATLSLSNGTLAITQPHPSPEAVADLIDSIRYAVLDGDNGITSVGITIVTDDATTQAAVPPLPEPPADPAPADTDSGTSGTSGTVSGPLRS
jgi:hypothetical protein